MLRLRLLGSFELRGPGDRVLKIPARKTRALLAFLALQNGARQSRERLAALLWEDADAELARSSLRQALTALRRALPAKQQGVLEADAHEVALNLAQVQVDVLRLRALLADSSAASLKAARAIAAESLLEGFDARSGAFDRMDRGGTPGASTRTRGRGRRSSPRFAATSPMSKGKSTHSTGCSRSSRCTRTRTAS